jgi:hypothetical protein
MYGLQGVTGFELNDEAIGHKEVQSVPTMSSKVFIALLQTGARMYSTEKALFLQIGRSRSLEGPPFGRRFCPAVVSRPGKTIPLRASVSLWLDS